jgi:hypothetical protein
MATNMNITGCCNSDTLPKPRSLSLCTAAIEQFRQLGEIEYHLPPLPNSPPPEIPKPIRSQLRVAHRVLNVAVPEPSLQRPGIVPLVGKLVATAMAQHVRMDREWHASPVAETLDQAWKLFGAIGAPRSDTNTCGPSACSRCRRRNARSSSP